MGNTAAKTFGTFVALGVSAQKAWSWLFGGNEKYGKYGVIGRIFAKPPPKPEPPPPEPKHTLVHEEQINPYRKLQTWVDGHDKMYEKYEVDEKREKLWLAEKARMEKEADATLAR